MPIPGVVGSDYAVTPCRVRHFRDLNYQYAQNSPTTSPRTFTGLNWIGGDTIVVVVSSPGGSGFTMGLPTCASLTFSLIQEYNNASNGYVGSWSAPAGTDQTNQTITITRSGGSQGFNVFVYIIANGSAVIAKGAGLMSFSNVAVSGGSTLLYSISDVMGVGSYAVRAGSGIYSKRFEYGDGVATGYQIADYQGVSQGTNNFGSSSATMAQQLIEITSAKFAPPRPAFKSDLGWGRSNASGTTLTITLTTPVAAGDLIIVRVAYDNLASGPTTTCTDTAGNSYTQANLFSSNVGVAGGGVIGCYFFCKVTYLLTVGNQITITFSSAITAKAAYAESFIGFTGAIRSASTATSGTGTSPSFAAPLGSANDLVLSYVAAETFSIPTGISTFSGNGNFSSLNLVNAHYTGTEPNLVQIMGQHKILTGSAAVSFGYTLGASSDWCASALVMVAG